MQDNPDCKPSIMVLFNGGYNSDFITVYDDGSFAGDVQHSKTTRKAIAALIKKQN